VHCLTCYMQSSSAGRTSSSSSSASATSSVSVEQSAASDSDSSSIISQSAPTSGSNPTTKASPVTSVQVVTQSGNVITHTVTSMPTAGSTALIGASKKSSMSPGLIAAAVIASLFGVALIGLIAFFLLRRRKKANENEKFGGLRDSTGPANLNRNASTHSKAGLLERAYPPTIATRYSSHGALDASSGGATSPVTPSSDRRGSKAILYDQRLNPNSLMILDNGSHTSLRTLEDHRDYGRMLKVTNPDAAPEPRPSTSGDSRPNVS